jgi:hypothetical protein
MPRMTRSFACSSGAAWNSTCLSQLLRTPKITSRIPLVAVTWKRGFWPRMFISSVLPARGMPLTK